jgi:hypothetical protein
MATERTINVSVRVTPEEHERWLAAAEAEGRGQLGAWARDRVNDSLDAAAPVMRVQERRRIANALRKLAIAIDGNHSA